MTDDYVYYVSLREDVSLRVLYDMIEKYEPEIKSLWENFNGYPLTVVLEMDRAMWDVFKQYYEWALCFSAEMGKVPLDLSVFDD